MKKIVVVISLLTATIGYTQEKKINKNQKVFYRVDGICGMCKTRIETAALKTKGVKFALWNVETKQLNLIIDERKTDVATTQKNVAAAGHDVTTNSNKEIKATEIAYDAVHPCCKYRDEEIVKKHNGELEKQVKTNK